jgi:HKD family nuclease
MSIVEFISNNNKSNHLDFIKKYFVNADAVWMATAFLKNTGLDLLLPALKKHVKAGKPVTIIAGQNFGLTEPKALKVLHDLFKTNSKALLYVDKAENKQQVFHPKLFIFRHKNNATVISGSANITNGGLDCNEEFSVSVQLATSNTDWKILMEYFNDIISVDKADLCSRMIINRYEQFYNEQKKAREKQKVAPDKKSSEYTFDYRKLRERLKEYKQNNYLEDLRQRIKDYKEAKALLNEIADTKNLSQNRFAEIIDSLVVKNGTHGLWRSGSLYRHRFDVHTCKDEFQQLIRFIKDNQTLPASKVFVKAKELVEKIDGARMNYVAEIMMTYQPDRFANINSNPIKVLKEEAGVYFKSHSNSFNGEDYEEYCAVIIEICRQLDLNNMLEADSFFNDIYWKLK